MKMSLSRGIMMSKIRALRELITKTLDDINVNNYYAYAPDNTQFPYATYALQEMQSNAGFTQYELDINAYDNNYNSIIIEELVESIQEAFNYKNEVVGCFSFAFYKNITNVIDNKSDKLQRRRVTFEVRTYSKL